MALYKRLCWEEEPHIPIHAFQAAVAEVLRGKITAAAARDFFGLSTAEATEVQTLITRVQTAGMSSAEVDHILLLADIRFPGYETEAGLKSRFGIT